MKTKERILAGAKQYLLDHGQAGFTIRAIAKEADVNKGLVHHYFGSKENLVLELIDYVVEAPFVEMKKTMSGKSQEDVKNLILNLLRNNTDLVNMIFEFMYFAQHSERIKEKLRNIARERRDFIASCFGVDDPQKKYTLNSGVFGIIFFSRLETEIDIDAALTMLFRKFEIL